MDELTNGTNTGNALDPAGELQGIVGDCVHCGFCLPSCPTYQLWGEEMDSPRGRIHLIGQLLNGEEASDAAAEHLDRCLGCMACVPACPSGVRYDKLIEAARSWAADAGAAGAVPVTALPPRSARERALRAAIFATFPYPARMRWLMGPLRAAQRTRTDKLVQRGVGRLAPELAAALRLAPALPGPPARPGRPGRPPRRVPRGRLPSRIPARGERRAVVGMLTGCVQQVFFPQVNLATARVLAAEGCDVVIPPAQRCCGALSLHDGRRAEARAFAASLIATFEQAGVDAIVVNSAGCGSAMKEYGDLLADDQALADRAAALSARVADLSEFLAALGPAAPRHALALTVAYHDACHLAHAQRITSQPRGLLRAIPGIKLVELADAGTCCGSAGIYNLVQPGTARELGDRKAAAVSQAGADLVVSANPGCALQISSALAAAGTPVPVAHLAEVLDASIRGQSPATLR
ncbi:MAG TPA: heterodisulfide reductase-related iron-sulfur binding cluster [Streptosporangiaceae bacterium]|nr:heterodisulfide reductase-related iron-sulfur binding cluster [Streptosporangiaceae bacterium]